MKAARFFILIISLVVLPILLFHFQNCGPVNVAPAGAAANSQPQVIENSATNSLQFVVSQVEVRDDAASVGVDGLCTIDLNGIQLSWSFWSDQGAAQPLESGTANCDNGQFEVMVPNLDQVVCGVTQRLMVQGPHNLFSTTSFIRRCQPLASRPIPPPENSPMGTTCSLEYSPASAAEQPCVQVCYRGDIVVDSQNIAASECSSLAESLAGP